MFETDMIYYIIALIFIGFTGFIMYGAEPTADFIRKITRRRD